MSTKRTPTHDWQMRGSLGESVPRSERTMCSIGASSPDSRHDKTDLSVDRPENLDNAIYRGPSLSLDLNLSSSQGMPYSFNQEPPLPQLQTL
ncbi:hypothetical protein J1N35_034436 [Gossypium stocksii]|uniref:Uncharacterized protein n=1 Tax=Gossypium stocksii TaxID=47602 RepID=A0A9D3US04_9ROSI|nr:hypothetical protein J1N35_034436 [Gossypium stocksii]